MSGRVTRGFLLLFFVFSLRQVSAKAEPTLEVTLSKQKITLSETALLTVQIEWPKGEANYSFVLPSLRLENLFLERQGESQENIRRNGQELIRKIFVTELRAEKPGVGKIDSFDIRYIDPVTQAGGAFSISEQKITVVKPPLNLLSLLVWTMPLALLTAAGVFFVFIRRHSRKLEAQPPASRAEEAIQRFKSNLERTSEKTQKDLLFEWNVELRHFVIDFYELGTDARLNEEKILEKLEGRQVPREEVNGSRQLFDRLREARFLGLEISQGDLKRLQSDLLRYLEGKRIVGHTSGGL